MQPLPPPKGLGCPDSGLSCAQGGPEALHQHPLPSLPAAPGLLLLWVVWTFYEASGLSTGLMSPEIGSHFPVLTMESHSGNSNRTPGIFVRTPRLASVSLETLRGPPQRGMEGGLWLEVPSVGEHQAGASPGPAHQFCSAPEDSTRDPRCLPSCGTITLNPDLPAWDPQNVAWFSFMVASSWGAHGCQPYSGTGIIFVSGGRDVGIRRAFLPRTLTRSSPHCGE